MEGSRTTMASVVEQIDLRAHDPEARKANTELAKLYDLLGDDHHLIVRYQDEQGIQVPKMLLTLLVPRRSATSFGTQFEFSNAELRRSYDNLKITDWIEESTSSFSNIDIGKMTDKLLEYMEL
jgi:hypothetical protein